MKRDRPGAYAQAIQASYQWLPVRIAERLRGADFFCGIDPRFAGLHSVSDETARAHPGGSLGERSYATSTHTVYTYHQEALPKALRAPTIVLGTDDVKGEFFDMDITHELGHILHEQVGFVACSDYANKSEYARLNNYEAFACYFMYWVYWPERLPWCPTKALLEELAA